MSAPPGLAFVTVSDKAMEVMEHRKVPVASFYCNLLTFKNYKKEKWFPYTMPASDINGLEEAVRLVQEDTERITRHEKIAQAVRQAVTAAGLSLYLNFGDANTVTVIRVPEGMKDTDIIRHMKETYGILISGSFDVLAGKVIRLGHMGNNARKDEVAAMLEALEKTLADLGFVCKKSMAEEFAKVLDS